MFTHSLYITTGTEMEETDGVGDQLGEESDGVGKQLKVQTESVHF
jgi:hypothetical protein